MKAGLSVGVALTAVTVAGALRQLMRTPFTFAEGTTTQSIASAAGYSTGSTLASSGAAWVLLNGHPPPAIVIAAWTLGVSLFGCLLAWPLRGVFLHLPFPSGTAAAVALKSLWEKGAQAIAQTRALAASMGVSAALTLGRDQFHWLPATLAPTRWGFGFDLSLLALGAGALLGLRLGLSLLLGAVLTYGVLQPGDDFGTAAGFAMWPGTALFAASALTHLVFQLSRLTRVSGVDAQPARFAAVLAVAAGLAVLGHFALGIPWLAVALSLLLAFPLCLVSIRVTGETDVTPGGPLGQLTQLGVGVATLGNPGANVMAGGLSAGAAASAADLMTDLKTGALLQVPARQQLIAQLIGCAVGSVCVAPLFVVLVPSVSALGTNGFAAPAAQMFASFARLLVEGTRVLPPNAATASIIASALGVLLAAVEARFPKAAGKLPSPVALGLAMLLPPSMSITFAAGAVIAFLWARKNAASSELLAPPIAAGLIAGESLAGAGIAIAAAVG